MRIRGAASLPVGTTRHPCFANVRARTPRLRSSSAARVRHARERHVSRRASPRARRRREYAVARLDKSDRCDHDGRSLRAPEVVSEELGSSARSCPLARSFAHGRRSAQELERARSPQSASKIPTDKLLANRCKELVYDGAPAVWRRPPVHLRRARRVVRLEPEWSRRGCSARRRR